VSLVWLGAATPGWSDSATAETRAPSARVSLSVAGHQRTFDTMSYSDIRPVPRGEVGGRLEIGARVGERWWAIASGHFGGAWFDFSGPSVSGTIEDFSWVVRGGLDRRSPVGNRAEWYMGLGGEYGESRSWLDALTTEDEGPRVYLRGGYVKLGAATSIGGPFQLYADATQSVFMAHARQAKLENKYNWLGRALEGAIGVRLALPAK
jgi:hypothetical protein